MLWLEDGEFAEAVELAVDPVCGMSVERAKATTAERDGATVFFCSRGLVPARPRPELTVSSTEASANGAKEALMDHHTMSEQPGEIKDPVCGMTVDAEQAKAKGLTTDHEGTTYYFCGRGCKLEFADDPGRYLDPTHKPSM